MHIANHSNKGLLLKIFLKKIKANSVRGTTPPCGHPSMGGELQHAVSENNC